MFVAVCHLFLLPNIVHLLCSVICTRSEACAPGPLSLAKLDYCDIHGALKRRRSYGTYFGLSRDSRRGGERGRSPASEEVRAYLKFRNLISLLPPLLRSQMLQSLREAVPLVKQAIASSIIPSMDPPRLRQLQSALKCLEAWIPNLPSKYASAILRNATAAPCL